MNRKDTIALALIFFLTPVVLLAVMKPFSNRVLMGELKTVAPVEVLLTREVSPEGVVTQTIDASQNRWIYFNFRNGVLPEKGEDSKKNIAWDLAFQRKRIITNSPPMNEKGRVGLLNISTGDFDRDFNLPQNGFIRNRLQKGKIINTAIDKWYDYNFMDHSLTPKEEIYLVKGADDQVVKMKIESYYCGSDKLPACYTLRFAWLN